MILWKACWAINSAKLYIKKIDENVDEKSLPKALGKDLLFHISNQKNELKKKQSITAWLLLSQIFDFKNQENINKDFEVKYTKNDKPYILNMPFFSISHSEEYIAIAVCNEEIGCDIQFHKQADFLNIAKRFFNETDIEYIINSQDKSSDFYEVWTKKESFVKMTGEGFGKSFKSFNVFDFNYYFNNSIINKYSIAVCIKNNDLINNIEIISFF